MSWLSRLFGRKEEAMKMEPAQKADVAMAKDPVCGMDVDPGKAAGESEYQGETYYFCAPACKKAFDENPEKYLKGAGEEHRHT